MLEHLNTIEGVLASSANYSGTLVRVVVTPAANREKVAEEVLKCLPSSNRQTNLVTGYELQMALQKEEWRELHQIGQLSAIEFRTLALTWVKEFVEGEHVADAATDQLVDLAVKAWDRLIELADRTEAKGPPHQMDWRGRCRQYAAAFSEQSKELLTVDQRDRVQQLLTGNFERLIPERT